MKYGVAEVIGALLGMMFIAVAVFTMIGLSVAVWAGIFWLTAYFIPGLEVWAQTNGAHFWYGGVIVGLLRSVVWRKAI